MPEIETLIKRLPKCELHIHIEGSLEPELMFALAKRNNVKLPHHLGRSRPPRLPVRQPADFLDVHYQGMLVLVTERDFYDLAWAYLTARAGRQRPPRGDVLRSARPHRTRRAVCPTVIGGLHRAIADARRELGVDASLIMCFLRDLDEADAEKTLDLALGFCDQIAGVGLDFVRIGHPPSKFKRVFRRARDAGLFFVRACR